ncbi:DUF1775 domain-containing protein [Streptomyces decoyicus]|uniref:DUF1775 domain-containing protein n=1 Tax=Streptomyces decoyicus TaxID=249567 RepID=UPI00386DA229
MSRITALPRALRRTGLATSVAAAAVVLAAGPAFAHVEVESEGAQALAKNVRLGFEAESESDKAGITELKVVLPEGIAPADVKLADGPKGWTLTAGSDGYTVKGPALPVGENAEYAVTVRQLPDAKELAFKTLQTYSDKRVDRWIEIGEGGENPAPMLKLKAAAPGAKPEGSASSPEKAAPSPEPSKPASADESAKKDDEGGLPTGAWIGIGATVVVLAGVSVYVVRRRAS